MYQTLGKKGYESPQPKQKPGTFISYIREQKNRKCYLIIKVNNITENPLTLSINYFEAIQVTMISWCEQQKNSIFSLIDRKNDAKTCHLSI